MENLKTNWKLSKKTKNPRSQQEIGCEEIENILKTAGFILFFSKKVALSPAIIQNFAGRRGNKSVQPPKNGWTSLQKATWKLVGEIANFRRYSKEKSLWHLFCHRLMEVTTRFELVNEGFADLCLTTWPRHHISENWCLPISTVFWSGRRGSNSLPPPWQGGALPDELRPQDVYSLRRIHKKWCLRSESNQWHGDFQSPALPTELQRQMATRIRLELTTSSVTG